jgi:hypothetical protein
MSINNILLSTDDPSSGWHRTAIVIAHSCHERVNANEGNNDPHRATPCNFSTSQSLSTMCSNDSELRSGHCSMCTLKARATRCCKDRPWSVTVPAKACKPVLPPHACSICAKGMRHMFASGPTCKHVPARAAFKRIMSLLRRPALVNHVFDSCACGLACKHVCCSLGQTSALPNACSTEQQ